MGGKRREYEEQGQKGSPPLGLRRSDPGGRGFPPIPHGLKSSVKVSRGVMLTRFLSPQVPVRWLLLTQSLLHCGAVSMRLVGGFGRGDEETVQRHDSTPLNYKSPCTHDSSPLTDSTMELPVSANKPEHHDLPHQPASPSQFAGSRINVFAIIGFVFLAINFLDSAFRSRHDPSALAFAVFVYSDLALLFVCLRNFEKLGADCSPAKKERSKAAVWALASALNLALAWRVAEIMPPMLAVVVWLMAGLVTLGGFYGLFLYRDADDIVAAHDYSPVKNNQASSPEDQV